MKGAFLLGETQQKKRTGIEFVALEMVRTVLEQAS